VDATEDFKPKSTDGRERHLKDTEIAALWTAVDNDSDYGRIIKLLILTAARRTEVGGMRWDEFTEDTWTIPAERSKNKRKHELPLTQMMREVLDTAQQKRSDFLFGLSAAGGFSGWGASKRSLDARLNLGEPWTLHDLRRSVATWLGENGVEPWIVEAVLNHRESRKGVAATYNRAKYQRQIRNALMLWHDHLRSLIDGGERKVIPLREVG
jgi:integrase